MAVLTLLLRCLEEATQQLEDLGVVEMKDGVQMSVRLLDEAAVIAIAIAYSTQVYMRDTLWQAMAWQAMSWRNGNTR